MLKCREFVAQADDLLAGDLTLRQRLLAHLHLFLCDNCRRYWHQLRILVAALRKMGKRAPAGVVDRVMQAIRAGT